MPETAKRKRTKKERARLIRRVFLGGAIGLLIVAIGWFAFHEFDGKHAVQQASAIEDTTPHGVYCAQECFLINASGIAFKKTSRPGGNLLLVIENEHREDVSMGGKVIDPNIIAELTFLRKTLAEELGVRLGKAAQSRFNTEDFDIETDEGWRLRMSTTNNAHATTQILARTLDKLGKERATLQYIDLRIENRVYYKTL